ncbi:CoA-binding protein [Mycolicibacterium smegmatis]|uniref:CoA-binding protein n=1 Tax=Mycolicibacterium smegmatis (strain MKD8) TaxID=1214915 RepID=A0A2U9PIM1_MYCSE|nr:CoA-binding protein [Mycolicibacterium smegmatis]AWT51580.1 CoA-binding protein [Mycolicibacterium smegmatis MKD8]
MTTTAVARSLAQDVFSPASVAMIGASDNPSKLIAYRPVEYLRTHGYAGSIYPINPQRSTVQGLPCYPSILQTPTAPELVIVALPRERVLAAVEECARAGVKVVIIYTSGFSEVPDGRDLAAELVDLAHRTGIRVIGPNCQGIANLSNGFLPCFSTSFSGGELAIGPAAIISQSGAIAGMIYNRWAEVGGGVTHWASTGNEADVTVSELALAVVEDSAVELMFLYLESVRNEQALAALAVRARELNKHIVVFRPARTRRSWEAAARHTGAGASPDDTWRHHIPTNPHVHVANSIEDLVTIGQAARSGKKLLGSSVGIISNSGGLGVATCDAAVGAGFTVDSLAEVTHEALSDILPGFASVENPVDITAQLLNESDLLSRALPTMLRAPEVDAMMVSLGAVGDGYNIEQIIADIVAAQAETTKPIVVSWVGSRVDVQKSLGAARVPVFTEIDRAVAALATMRPPVPALERRPGPNAPYFECLSPGATYQLGPVVIDGADMDHYARAAHQIDDTTNVHVDLEAARAAGFTARVVSGLHTLTVITMLGHTAGLWTNSPAVAGFDRVRFLQPVLEGDTVDATLTVLSTRGLGSGRGLVTFEFSIARDQVPVVEGEVTYVFRTRVGAAR